MIGLSKLDNHHIFHSSLMGEYTFKAALSSHRHAFRWFELTTGAAQNMHEWWWLVDDLETENVFTTTEPMARTSQAKGNGEESGFGNGNTWQEMLLR